jgi:hypothetical protein
MADDGNEQVSDIKRASQTPLSIGEESIFDECRDFFHGLEDHDWLKLIKLTSATLGNFLNSCSDDELINELKEINKGGLVSLIIKTLTLVLGGDQDNSPKNPPVTDTDSEQVQSQ